MTKKPLIGLAAFLHRQGMISESEAAEAVELAARNHSPLVSELIKVAALDEQALAKLLAETFDYPLFDLTARNDDMPLAIFKESQIKQWHLLPLFQRGEQLFVAMSDPLNLQAISDAKRHTSLSLEVMVVLDSQLQRMIYQLFHKQHSKVSSGLETTYDLIEYDLTQSDDGQVVSFVNTVIAEAIKRGASDIHFEPYEQVYRIRMRLDGVLQTVAQPPISIVSRLTSRLKIMAQLDIAERRVPQDGRFKLQINDDSIDFRVSTCPTLFGEKIVLRILDRANAELGIDSLGFSGEQKAIFMRSIAQPQGMVIVTGPTGSGKTMTMYTALNLINTEDNNICTVEDPVEINLPGINQVHVNPKAGLTFASALRAFLRQDPDIIMVGEIRDLETAEIAVKSAQTGHLVLSTLHTNSAAETLTRLISMGMQSYNVASAIMLIIAQRLARRLCPHCKAKQVLPLEALLEQGFTEAQAKQAKIYKAVGCDKCNLGYKGRIGLFEVLPVSPTMQQLIMRGGDALEIAKLASSEGVDTIRQDGLKKVLAGITSLDEINRVSKG